MSTSGCLLSEHPSSTTPSSFPLTLTTQDAALTPVVPRPTDDASAPTTKGAARRPRVRALDGAGEGQGAQNRTQRTRAQRRLRVKLPTRAAPRVYKRQDALSAALRTAAPSVRAACLLVAEDLLAHAVRVRGPVHHGAHVVERGPAYYAACGKLPEGLARQAVSMLARELSIPRLPVDQVRALGVPVRQLKPGKQRGRYLLLRPAAHKAIKAAARDLRIAGVVPPEPTRAQPILGPARPVEMFRRGRHTFIHCPSPDHDDSDPSGLVNPDGAVYCFGCSRLVAYVEDAIPDPSGLGDGEIHTARARLILDWRADKRPPRPDARTRARLLQEKRQRQYEQAMQERRALNAHGSTSSPWPDPSTLNVLDEMDEHDDHAIDVRDGEEHGDHAPDHSTDHPPDAVDALERILDKFTPSAWAQARDDRSTQPTTTHAAHAQTAHNPHASPPKGCYADASSQPSTPTLTDTAIHGPVTSIPAYKGRAFRACRVATTMGHIGSPEDPLEHVRRYIEQHKVECNTKRGPDRAGTMRIGFVTGKRSPRGFLRKMSTTLDLLDILRHAQSRNCSDRARDKVYRRVMNYQSIIEQREPWKEEGLEYQIPDQFVSLHHQYGTDYVTPSKWHGHAYATRFEPVAVRWVGVDLDDVRNLSSAKLADAAVAIERWCESRVELTGRMGMVRTSRTGVQVVVELAATRWKPATTATRPYDALGLGDLHDRLDAVCLEAVRATGATHGHADRSIRALGRYARLPGPRVKDGEVEYATLIYASP